MLCLRRTASGALTEPRINLCSVPIGGRIRELRATRGMSQDDLAARVYVSRQTISSWENGKAYPDVQSLLLLSEIFGASVDSLIKDGIKFLLV